MALPVLSQLGVQRRQGLKLLVLLSAGAATFAGYRSSPYSADLATRTGQRRLVTLSDGSRLELNTDTRVDIAYGPQERLIILNQGEILLTTAADRPSSRPLSVETPHGRILALGTRFDVRLHSGFSTVDVLSHSVEVRPKDAPQQARRVEEGQALTFGASQVGSLRPAPPGGSSWTQGLLVANDWRLVSDLWGTDSFVAQHPDITQLLATAWVKAAWWISQEQNQDAYYQLSSRAGTAARSRSQGMAERPQICACGASAARSFTQPSRRFSVCGSPSASVA